MRTKVETHRGPTVAANGRWEVCDCKTCGYAHLFPTPEPADVVAYYGEQDGEYGTPAGKAWLDKENEEHLSHLWDSYYYWQARLVIPGKIRLGYAGKLLDVGAGAGHFVAWWRRNLNSVAAGVEPSGTCREFSTVPMYVDLKDMQDWWVQRIKFDVLRFSLVLEHVPDPAGLVRSYLPFLAPGGRVLVVVPNEFNPLQRLASRSLRNDWWVSEKHLNYFDEASLRRLLESVGLTVTRVGATHPTELWRLAGLRSEAALRRAHRARLALERAVGWRIFEWYSLIYRRLGWGRELVVVAEDKGQPLNNENRPLIFGVSKEDGLKVLESHRHLMK